MFIKKIISHSDGPAAGGAMPLFVDRTPEQTLRSRDDNVIDVVGVEHKTAPTEPQSSATTSGGFGKFLKSKPTTAVEEDLPKKRFFGKDATSSAPEKLVPSAEPGASRKSIFARAAKPDPGSASTPLPQKPVKAAKTARASHKPASPRDSLVVLVELDGNKKVAWRLTSTEFEEVELDQVSRAASFSRNEYRFRTDTPLPYGKAQDMALAEIGEEIRIVNGSRQVGAVYASTAERIKSLGEIETGPGLFLVEQLLQAERKPGEEAVVCAVLTGAQASRSLAVLYHFTKNDEVAATQITVNPDNLNFVLSQFAASRRLDGDNTRFIVFRNEDLLKVAGKLSCYPVEAMWRGVSMRRVLWGAVVTVGVVAAGSAAFAAQAYFTKATTQSRLSAASAEKSRALKEIDTLLAVSIVSFAQTQAMPLGQVTVRAGKLWVPAATVVLDATAEKETYSVVMPLTRGSSVGNNPSVLNRASLAQVEPLLNIRPPEGCSKDVPKVSGGMNAVQIIVTCENPSGPLASYRLN